MAVYYHCRHCGNEVGAIDTQLVDAKRLGIHSLSAEERKSMISYTNEGHVNIQTICEDCQESLERNPDFHELDQFIQ
ncbi:anti-sigma-F factor Fin family protein [Jeotgalibacillus aurantiacus]|uniref:anti-sigma-F factor Fin family protein n=1 Tax=Jeotgalibacillus aurantiacus TaxID=2763266 RepID=UPI001D0BAEF7|nr:anti-sigma-F factor Fin family protein [Jeotgalibacillus aurantiacus]